MTKTTNFIDGVWQEGSLGTLEMINPSYGTKLGEIARSGATDVDLAVQAANRAFSSGWKQTPAAERGRMLRKAADLLLQHADELAEIESADTGKPLRQAQNDARQIARYLEFYAGAAEHIHGETIPVSAEHLVFTKRVPLGVTGHIIPWNYPLQMTGRTLGAALAAGNATILKPAEDACLGVVRAIELMADAGFPPGVINLITGTGEEAGQALADHPGIQHLAFTGSPEIGAHVMKCSATHIRPVVLELGGKSPQVVFADADLARALPVLVNAIIQNAGQTCSAGSRILVQEEIHDLLVERLSARFRSLVVGPADQNPDVGPLVSKKQLERVRTFVDEALTAGAEIAAQASIGVASMGSPSPDSPSADSTSQDSFAPDSPSADSTSQDSFAPDSPSADSTSQDSFAPESPVPESPVPESPVPESPSHGFFYPPTLVTRVDPQSTIARKEVFGPVLVVIPFRDEEEAIRLANDVEYGLVAAVWTETIGRAHRVADAIDAGQVYVNGYGAGGGVELPFGGMKKSGFGREKGFEALHEVTAVKTYVINKG